MQTKRSMGIVIEYLVLDYVQLSVDMAKMQAMMLKKMDLTKYEEQDLSKTLEKNTQRIDKNVELLQKLLGKEDEKTDK